MIAIIGILIALLLPAVQSAREAARLVQCSNNLKQIGLALLNYENTCESFPPGGLTGGDGGYGHSWWVRILPFIEQETVYDNFDQTNYRHSGWVGGDGWGGNVHNRDLLRNRYFFYMFCPSSTLPPFVLTSEAHNKANTMSATYAGIAGAIDHATTRDKGPNGGAYGKISWGGSLVIDQTVAIPHITDGTSNTMVVGEQSGWCIDGDGNEMDCRSDCGHGFPMGPGNDGWERAFNVTCVIHAINERSGTALGIPGNCGPNRPIQSAHPDGAQILLGDGSVRFVSETLEIQTLYDLANKDNGHFLGGF